MCPENCLSSWNVYTQKNGTHGTWIIDEKIILSCGRITFQNIFTLFIFLFPLRQISERYWLSWLKVSVHVQPQLNVLLYLHVQQHPSKTRYYTTSGSYNLTMISMCKLCVIVCSHPKQILWQICCQCYWSKESDGISVTKAILQCWCWKGIREWWEHILEVMRMDTSE